MTTYERDLARWERWRGACVGFFFGLACGVTVMVLLGMAVGL